MKQCQPVNQKPYIKSFKVLNRAAHRYIIGWLEADLIQWSSVLLFLFIWYIEELGAVRITKLRATTYWLSPIFSFEAAISTSDELMLLKPPKTTIPSLSRKNPCFFFLSRGTYMKEKSKNLKASILIFYKSCNTKFHCTLRAYKIFPTVQKQPSPMETWILNECTARLYKLIDSRHILPEKKTCDLVLRIECTCTFLH